VKGARIAKLDVKSWRAADRHTGIGRDGGVVYTYEHVPGAPRSNAELYRVECSIPFAKPTPPHRNVYYVPAQRLDEFMRGFGEAAETVIDVRPITRAQALQELEQFRLRGSGVSP
jgi:hypothetical protein